jgi:Uma2 family endonuclease
MATVAAIDTLADLLEQLGGIPPQRIRFRPPPGTATEEDVLKIEAKENRLCELVDGVLVEKPMGYVESILAGAILSFLREFVVPRNLGHVSGADGMMRLFPGLVRIPDVAFASWERFPGGKLPESAIPDLAPDLAVEVLSSTNTPDEMRRKRREYFDAGVKLVWIVDPRRRSVAVFTSADDGPELFEPDTLSGGEVLPGFSLAVTNLFSELDRVAGQSG